MYEYCHGGDVYALQQHIDKEIIDFSASINPYGLPETIRQAMISAIDRCKFYPDPFSRALTEKVASYEKVQESTLYFANGASEIIFRMVLALKPKTALLCAPTFSDYEKSLKTVNCLINYYHLKEENQFIIGKDYLDHIQKGLEILILCNPNNPTGQLCEAGLLLEILARAKKNNTFVLVDECFMDFVDERDAFSVKQHIGEYENLIILKAFTKYFGMPGVRLGYAITSNMELLDQIRDSGQDWSVSNIAQAAGISALNEIEYFSETKELIREEKEFLIDNLEKMGLKVYGSKANYVFFKLAAKVDLHSEMLKRGFLIRSCANYINLDSQFYRIAVMQRAQNLAILEAMTDIFEKGRRD